jgi:DNA-binding NtrC family response regulator
MAIDHVQTPSFSSLFKKDELPDFVGDDARFVTELQIPDDEKSAKGRLVCNLDRTTHWADEVIVANQTLCFVVLPRKNQDSVDPLTARVLKFTQTAQQRWRHKVETNFKLLLKVCNSEFQAFQIAGQAAATLFGPETYSHAYHVYAHSGTEAAHQVSKLLYTDSQWCAPTQHPPKSHIGETLATEKSIYEADLLHPRHKHLVYHWVMNHEPTRTAYTVYIDMGRSRRGAFQCISYLQDGFSELDRDALDRILAELVQTLKRLKKIGEANRKVVAEEDWPDGIVTKNERMKDQLKRVYKARTTNATVLITGENGSGKELIAKAVHQGGLRAEGPLVCVNCAALPETLVESELFGIEPNTASDVAGREGRMETANGGTLFLDEIADLSLYAQAKILRALQEHEIEHVGGRETIVVDFRLIAATNKDLWAEIHAGRFREDLYWRLNVIKIELPPLRERLDDIEFLATHFIAKYNEEHGKQIDIKLGPDALKKLMQHHWSGNVRELDNVIQKAVINCEEQSISADGIELEEPAKSKAAGGFASTFAGTWAEAVKALAIEYFSALLKKYKGNKSKAATHAGMNRTALYDNLKKFGFKVTPEEDV